MSNEDDYSVTWNEVKTLADEELVRRGKNENDKIPFGLIECILKKVWDEIFLEKRENGERQ